jgi:hypothetical protein
MNFFELFDPITLAIMAPTIALHTVILVAAVLKRSMPWPTRENHDVNLPIAIMPLLPVTKWQLVLLKAPGEVKSEFLLSIRTLKQVWPSQLVLYLSSFTLGTGFFSWSTHNLSWINFVDPLAPPLIQILIPLGLNVLFAILMSLPFACALQMYFFRRAESLTPTRALLNSRFIVSLGFLCSAMMSAIPAIQYALASVGLTSLDSTVIKELFRLGFALTTIPMSLIGVIIAFSNFRRFSSIIKEARYLSNAALSTADLLQKSDSELHSLIDAALATNNFEKADMISKLLLERAEQ